MWVNHVEIMREVEACIHILSENLKGRGHIGDLDIFEQTLVNGY
jgi:hypothetical protein